MGKVFIRLQRTIMVRTGSNRCTLTHRHCRAIDDCGRRWLSTSNNGLLIYDSQGQPLGSFNPPFGAIFDAVFIDNYVMLLSDLYANKIIRLDPQIES